MKRYSFKIGNWHNNELFAPIRNKIDIIKLLMKTLKIMIANQKIDHKKTIGEIVLIISKMSRLFYFSQTKYFSINFPFTATEIDERIIYSSKSISDIDSMITSQVLSIIMPGDSFDSDSIYEFADSIANIVDFNANFWTFFKDLLLYEDGYIRYDYDEKYKNDLFHPPNHYDVFYSPSATFKIGLRKQIEREVMIDLLRIESKCHFFE